LLKVLRRVWSGPLMIGRKVWQQSSPLAEYRHSSHSRSKLTCKLAPALAQRPYLASGSVAVLLGWGSGGRWFESSRPDITRPARISSSGGSCVFAWRPLCRILCRKPGTFRPISGNPTPISFFSRRWYLRDSNRLTRMAHHALVRQERAHVQRQRRVATRTTKRTGVNSHNPSHIDRASAKGSWLERA
jgi:hypothetical protein